MNKKFILGLIILLLLYSCDFFFEGDSIDKKITGTIQIDITQSKFRTISPEILMEIDNYSIHFQGPNGEDYNIIDIPGEDSNYTESGLAIGVWNILVEAYNVDLIKIAEGLADVNVGSDDTESIPITLVPLSGGGTLNISVSWPSDILIDPNISSTSYTLTASEGTSYDLVFTVDNTTSFFATSIDNVVDSGYYTLKINLYEGSDLCYPLVETVRIIEGQTTTGSYVLTEEDISFGAAISPVFDPPGGTYETGQTVSITTTSDAHIMYTSNGTPPSETVGILYENPISINSSTTLKAIAISNSDSRSNSVVVSADYVISDTITSPVFSINEGLYYNTIHVGIESSSENTAILYTTNGEDPEEGETGHWLQLGSTIEISEDTTLKALAYHIADKSSDVISANYVITGFLETPSYGPPSGGTYYDVQTLTITPNDFNENIYYTTNGDDPSVNNGTLYSEPIKIDKVMTVKAVSIYDNWCDSDINSIQFDMTVADPVYTISGTEITPSTEILEYSYNNDQTVDLATTTDDTIYYTLDGTDPDEATGTLFSEPFVISQNTTVKTVSIKTDWNDSNIITLMMNMVCTDPVITNIDGGEITGPFYSDQPIIINPESTNIYTDNANIYYTFDESIELDSTNGTLYSGEEILIDSSKTIKIIVVKDGYTNSNTVTGIYEMIVPDPVLSPVSSTPDVETITLTNTLGDATIIYTLDGEDPNEDSFPPIGSYWPGEIDISGLTDVVVKVKSYKSGWTDSNIVTETYNLSSP